MVDTFLPIGVPSSVHHSQAPTSEELPRLVEAAIAAKTIATPSPALLRGYQSLTSWAPCCTVLHKLGPTRSPTRSVCFAVQ
eukprot:6205964-Pleurochrysis_carterae.AAC.4